ncbi:MAG: toprim domain-containing protein [Parvibaculum sp.]|nr:toprim domain-containing protein [Parvibaculum sp.]
MTGLTKAAIEFAGKRGISAQTLETMRVVGGRAQFDDGTHEAIVFRYLDRDEEQVNYKARSLAGKRYKQAKGGKQLAYNWWQVAQGDLSAVYITEGEFDACALVEAGISPDSVISTPNGATAEEMDDPAEAKKYGWLIDAMEDGLARAGRYIIAADNDGPGRSFRSDVVRILGPAKTWFVDWPEGTKDANEFLTQYGGEALRGYIGAAAKPWPVEGVYTLSQIPEPAPLELWDLGFPEFEGKLKIAPTMLSVFTGYPGHGKSHMAQQVWFNIARQYGIRIAVFSAETRVKPFFRRNIRQFYWRCRESDMGEKMIEEADAWMEAHFLIIEHPKERPTVSWILNTAEVAVQRHGCRALLLDPWNKLRLDYDPRTTTEARYIGDALDDFMDLSRGLNIHTQIIAHPAKPEWQARKMAPDLYAVSGSALWNDRVDAGYCMFRPEIVKDGRRQTKAEFRCLKARFEELGYPSLYEMNFEIGRGRFVCTEFETRQEDLMRGAS